MTNPVTYNCPHCSKPFSVVPTAQAQVVNCPSCRGQVTIGPQQPAAPPPRQAPVPPPPQPQAPRPPPQQPMQPQYQQPYQQQPYQQQPYQQQPYPQQPYPQQYQQPLAPQPAPPPKKSKKGLVIGVVVVVAILIVAMLAYLFVFAGEEGPKTYSATYEEFLNDMDIDSSTFSVTFKTYDDGDIVDITGTVEKVKLADVPAGTTGADAGTWTLIYFEEPSASTVDMYDCFAYKGDKSGEYTIGEEGTVRVHIKKMSVMGITTEYPEESMMADAVEDYIPVPTVTYEDFLDDINIDMSSMTVTFDSYDDGDIVDVVGTVKNIRFADVPSGVGGLDSGTWTIVYFEPPNSSTTTIYDSFAYKGDISDEYTVGEKGTITVHIVEMSAMGITMEYPDEYMTADMVDDYLQVPSASLDFTETSPGNFTGGLVSASAEIYLNEIEIEIYDTSSGSYGTDDGDLTDDSPEEVEVWYGDLALEYTNANDNNKLDAGDVFTLTNAESGDEITIYDTYSYDEIASYTIV